MKTSPFVLNYNQIKGIADDFLNKLHGNLSIPIPIEEIVELKLGIKITTIPNLKSFYDIDGFINSTFNQITIDDGIFNLFEERARFTIAHELGHKILHPKIYSQFRIRTLDEYLNFQNKISLEDQKWLEIQANIFAGCVLVPAQKLREEFSLALRKAKISKGVEEEYFIPYIEQLPSRFKVSWAVLYRRMKKENLI